MDYKTELSDYIDVLIARDGSDIHLNAGQKPTFRVYRELYQYLQKDELTGEQIEELTHLLIPEKGYLELQKNKYVLFSYTHTLKNGEEIRLRGTIVYQRSTLCVSLRRIPTEIGKFEDLGLPNVLGSISKKPQGLFLIVGPAGQGKSTTLAAMIEYINLSITKHILTIENPIEYYFKNKKSIISQREIPTDCLSFYDGLEVALRMDANIIMIGEMRKTKTIQTVITAAEAGHLVFSTIHANSAAQTIYRVIDSFPSEQQGQIRYQLSQALIGIFSIRLIQAKAGGLVPAFELMLNNHAVANLIRENKVASLESVIQTSSDEGMISLNRSLAELVKTNKIDLKNAMEYSTDVETLKSFI